MVVTSCLAPYLSVSTETKLISQTRRFAFSNFVININVKSFDEQYLIVITVLSITLHFCFCFLLILTSRGSPLTSVFLF